MHHSRLLDLVVFASALASTACDKGSSNAAPDPPQAAPIPMPSAQEPVAAPTPPPPPPKADPVDVEGLKAGLGAMTPRISTQVEGLAKIEPTSSSRLFMHPGETRTSSIEFKTKGLASLELAPFIQDLGSNKDCADNPQAGIVDLTWSIDGKKNHLKVDRNYTGVLPVNLAGSSRLKLEVDKGESTLCDWFSIGFLNVKESGGPKAP
jgi:hypothetical protein